MREYDPNQVLLGLHIPKCAGSSLQMVIRSWFGSRVHWHYFDQPHNQPPKLYRQPIFGALLRRFLGREVCIFGHFNRARGFGIEDYYPNAEQFFTIVREPLAVMLSRYFFAKQLGIHRLREGVSAPIAAKYPTLNDFAAAQLDQPYFINYLPGPMTLDNYREILAARFVYVGVAEDLQTSVDRLAARLGFQPIQVPHIKSSNHDETLDPALAEAYIQSRTLEYAIYRYALEHYRD